MNKNITSALVLFSILCLHLGFPKPLQAGGSDGLGERRSGAEAMICVTVVDAEGKPIEGAPVKGYFYMYSKGKVNHDLALTDAQGRADIKGLCSSYDVNVELKQDGYYETSQNLDMQGNDYPGDGIVGVSKGKWHPYGLQRKYVFKERRKPVPMVVFRGTSLARPSEERDEFGYDLEYGSFVEPYGDGKVADFYVKYSYVALEKKKEKGKDVILYDIAIAFRFPNEKDGAYLFPRYLLSQFQSPYHADPDAEYARELVYSSTWEADEGYHWAKLVKSTSRLPRSQGLVLRTRSVVDPSGKLVSAHYSKIYGGSKGIRGELGGGGGVINQIGIGTRSGLGITTFFNPVANDTNLECDGKWYSKFKKGRRSPDLNGDNQAL